MARIRLKTGVGAIPLCMAHGVSPRLERLIWVERQIQKINARVNLRLAAALLGLPMDADESGAC